MSLRARSIAATRGRRAIARVPAGNDTDVELTTENDGPLLTEQSWVSSCPPGSVITSELDHDA